MIWWLAAAAASVVKSHWKTEIINLVLTGVLLILVVAACSAWLSFLPENSYGCLEEMWLVSNKWLVLVEESHKIPCQLRFEPAVKWYNLIMALLMLSCRSNCHRTRVDSPFMTFVIFHEESRHFRKGDETDTKCITKWTPFWTMLFLQILSQILSKKSWKGLHPWWCGTIWTQIQCWFATPSWDDLSFRQYIENLLSCGDPEAECMALMDETGLTSFLLARKGKPWQTPTSCRVYLHEHWLQFYSLDQ